MVPKTNQIISTISWRSFNANSRHIKGPKGKGKDVMTLILGSWSKLEQSKETTCCEQAKARRLKHWGSETFFGLSQFES